MADTGFTAISSKLPADVRQFLQQVRAALSGANRPVTRDDLVRAGVASVTSGGTVTAPVLDLTQPPPPTGLTATGAMTNILVEWDAPPYTNHSYAEVYASGVDDIGTRVMVGTSVGDMFSHAVGAGQTRYYWVRFISKAAIPGPFNAVAGTAGVTSDSPTWLLDVLTGELSESQLVTTLQTRIGLIDAPSTTTGSVAARIKASEDGLQAQINELASTPAYDAGVTYAIDDMVSYLGALYQAIAATTGNLPTNVTYWIKVGDYDSLGTAVSAHEAAITAINYVNAGSTSASAVALAAITATVNHVTTGLPAAHASILTEQSARIAGDTAVAATVTTLSSQVNHATTGLPAAYTAISNEASTRASADTAIAGTVTTLSSQVNHVTTGLPAAHAAVVSEASTRASADTAIAGTVTTLQTTVGNHTTSIQTNATSIDGLEAQYTVKIDANGYVTGYGLASTLVNATPYSEFAVVADKFSIAPVDSARDITFTQSAIPTALTGADLWQDTGSENLFLYSEQLDNAWWGKTKLNTTGTPPWVNVIDGPAGGLVAEKIIPLAEAVAATHYVGRTLTGPYVDGEHYFSGRVAKAGEFYKLRLLFYNAIGGAGGGSYADFDLTTGAMTARAGSVLRAGVVPMSDGYYYCWIAGTVDQAGTYPASLIQRAMVPSNAGLISHIANGTDGLYLAGSMHAKLASLDDAPPRYITTTTVPVSTVGNNTIYEVNGTDWSPAPGDVLLPDAGVPFFHLTAPTMINGVEVPAGTYMRAAYIQDASITNAKIGNLAVDDAKVASLSVAKLTAGSLGIGEYIQSTDYESGVSGWRVLGDGSAEFSNISARGNIEATSGTITGLTIQTATTGQRIEMDSNGMLFLTGDTPGGKYGSFKYGSGTKYGSGVLVYFNNASRKIPIYVQTEQTVADMHLYNRAANPTGPAEIGDLAVVGGKLKICTTNGTPGTWVSVGSQT